MPVRSRAFPSSPEATADARRFLRETTGNTLETQVIADAVLLTNELVTNVIKHACHEPEDPIEVVISLDEALLRVTVRDRGPGFDRAAPRERTEDGGWGLDLVKALASRWGVDRTTSGTEVWFEIDL